MCNITKIIIIILIAILLILCFKNSILEKFDPNKIDLHEQSIKGKQLPARDTLNPSPYKVDDDIFKDEGNYSDDYVAIAKCLVDYTGIINLDNADIAQIWPFYQNDTDYKNVNLTSVKPLYETQLPVLPQRGTHKLFCSDYNKINNGFSEIDKTVECNNNNKCEVAKFNDLGVNQQICKYKTNSSLCNNGNVYNPLFGQANVVSSGCKDLIKKHWESISIVNGLVNDCI